MLELICICINEKAALRECGLLRTTFSVGGNDFAVVITDDELRIVGDNSEIKEKLAPCLIIF